MHHHATARTVHHPATDMFDLVADVESYPQFVPLCTAVKVSAREGDPAGMSEIVARMTVAYGPLHESFTSQVKLNRDDLTIRVVATDGPFRLMETAWLFEPVSATESIVRFAIDYEFRSRTLGFLVGAVFERAFRRFTAAFLARADVVYGRRT